jgi:hypothetical protein
MAGTLVDFGTGDAIDLLGQAVGSVRYVATDAGDGLLTLADAAGATIGQFHLAAAAHAATAFDILPDGAGGSLIVPTAAAIAASAALTHPS